MMTVLFITIILISFVYILVPLCYEAYWPFMKGGTLSELHSVRKEGVMAISDLDDEYAMGKLTKEDYIYLREGLKHEIAPVLKKEMEMAGKETPGSDGPGQDSFTTGLLREVIRICGLKHSS
jgi:hypothetical protein